MQTRGATRGAGTFLAIAGAIVGAAVAAAAGDERLAARLAEIRDRRGVPAVWAGRFHADGRRIVAAAGEARAGAGGDVGVDDLVHLGSCTKAMTAVLVARSASAGRLPLDATLAGVFPGEVAADSPWRSVTIASLLAHTSGAPANADWQALDREHPGEPVAARRGLLRWLLRQPRAARPGHRYSNVGFAVAGHAVESVEGMPWERLMETELFGPLGIAAAGFGPLPPPGRDSGPWGHVVREGRLEPARIDNPPPLGPAGRVHASLPEWSRFVLAFVGDGAAARRRLSVAAPEWSRLVTPAPGESSAGGWLHHQRAWGGGDVLTHAGSNTAWTAVAWAAPRRGFCLLAAVNAGGDAAAAACDDAVAICLSPEVLPLEP